MGRKLSAGFACQLCRDRMATHTLTDDAGETMGVCETCGLTDQINLILAREHVKTLLETEQARRL